MPDRTIIGRLRNLDWSYGFGRVLNGMAAWLPLPAPQSLDNFREMVKMRAPRVYADLYGRYAPFEGRDVAEIGAGWGFAIDYYLSHKPRRYYALDVAHSEAIESEFRNHPMRDRLEVVRLTSSTFPLPSNCVDVVISENTFEHAIEYDATVEECRRILRTDGTLAVIFAPLFFSPYGAHLWHVVKFPWLHLMISERALRRIFYEGDLPSELQFDHDYHWDQYATLNRVRPHEFLKPFRSAGWHLVHTASYPLPLTYRAPEPIRSLLTHGMVIVARKR
jgi:SAM-dependent methyltransferase